MIENPGQKGIWTPVKQLLKNEDIKLTLLDFFDWQQLGWRDLRYFLVRVVDYPADVSLVGCNGLIEVDSVDILWEPPGILGLPLKRFVLAHE